MSTATIKRQYTPEEYLALEIRSDRKHEYFRGDIFLMTGGSPEHSRIKVNLYRLIGNALVDQPCELFDADMRVKVNANGLYTYPDASIACPPINIEQKQGAETLTNPAVLFEVLSPSTASYDRGGKFNLYRELPSLREYFLVSQDMAVVERRMRRDDNGWDVTVADGLDAAITVESIAFELKLRDLYHKVEFPAKQEE